MTSAKLGLEKQKWIWHQLPSEGPLETEGTYTREDDAVRNFDAQCQMRESTLKPGTAKMTPDEEG